MEIVLNGEQREFQAPLTVLELLKELDIDPDTVVVERNLNILSRNDLDGEPVENGDAIEIIQMVDGG